MHTNSTVGICPPVINLDDGGTYRSSPVQRWLWECWLDQVERVKRIDASRKVLILNGDLGELDTKRRSTQLISANKAVIQAMVTDTLAPLVDVVDDVIVIRGTMAHTGKGGWLEESIAADLDHAIRPGKAKAPAVDFDTVKEAFTNLLNADKVKAKAVLTEAGLKKLSEVDQDDEGALQDLLNAINEALEDEDLVD
jgi:hypothetical protein